jgi:eukaryotic-like serine/threonine-protein kinase
MWSFLPLPLESTPTETPLATRALTEDASTPTEAPILVQAPTEDIPTPTEEPSATPEPTESATSTASAPSSEITDDKGAEMVLIEAGNFTMGSTKGDLDERPIHSVYLNAYYIDKFEVTNALYQACANSGTCKPPVHADSFTRSSYFGNPTYDDYPVVYVDWNMAKTYCEWRGAQLPTEAQWEKAARGTEEPTYPWGRGVDCQKANYTNGHNACVGGTSKVGIYEGGKSPYGVYDMAGNVWEWVADWYSATYYTGSLSSNPSGPDSGRAHILRGGSWSGDEADLRSSNRLNYAPSYNNFDIGFRCVSAVP